MKRRPGTTEPKRSAWRRFTWRTLWLCNWGLLVVFFGGLGTFFGAYTAVAPIVQQMPDISRSRMSEGTKILSTEGKLLGRVIQENREYLPLDKIPDNLKKAFIAVEDSDFYKHPGVDAKGIMRALWKNIAAGRMRQGGSTITQQLARNHFNLRKRTLQRKVQEFLLALEIERRYTKDEILEMYLNEIYFGERAYGIKVAAKTYFNKEPGNLSLAECALLAGIPKGPNIYDPYRDPERAKKRRDFVLKWMAEVGYITPERAQQAQGQPIKLDMHRVSMGRRSFIAPYFCDYVLREAEDLLGPEKVSQGGLTIYTTLNWDIQRDAERTLRQGVQNARRFNVSQGALVSVDYRTGAIKAMVGGVGYAESQFNRAVQGNRQVGSAFKPFVYATAINQGMTPRSVMVDAPVSYPNGNGGRWTPHNYNSRSHSGAMSLERALALSNNVIAVKLADKVGINKVVATATSLGLRGPLDPYLSLALGTCSVTPLEMAGAYGTFASGGYRADPYGIAKIDDASGDTLAEAQVSPVRVLSQSTAQTMTDMMRNVIRWGTASGSVHRAGGLSFEASGKTGTTSDNKDAWFVGWGGNLVTAVWVGNDQPQKMRGVTGSMVPVPIWTRFMREAVPVMAEKQASSFVRQDSSIDQLADSLEQPRSRLRLRTNRTPTAPNNGEQPGGDNPALPPANGGPDNPPPGDDTDNQPVVQPENAPAAYQPKPEAPPEMVAICAVTGKRATYYCPRKTLRSFSHGTAPKSTCPLHPDPYKER